MYMPIVKTFNYGFLEMPAIKTMLTPFLSTSLPINWHTLVYIKSPKPNRAHWYTLGPLLQSQHSEDRKRKIRNSRLASTIY